jgi:hypothetical protein
MPYCNKGLGLKPGIGLFFSPELKHGAIHNIFPEATPNCLANFMDEHWFPVLSVIDRIFQDFHVCLILSNCYFLNLLNILSFLFRLIKTDQFFLLRLFFVFMNILISSLLTVTRIRSLLPTFIPFISRICPLIKNPDFSWERV